VFPYSWVDIGKWDGTQNKVDKGTKRFALIDDKKMTVYNATKDPALLVFLPNDLPAINAGKFPQVL